MPEDITLKTLIRVINQPKVMRMLTSFSNGNTIFKKGQVKGVLSFTPPQEGEGVIAHAQRLIVETLTVFVKMTADKERDERNLIAWDAIDKSAEPVDDNTIEQG